MTTERSADVLLTLARIIHRLETTLFPDQRLFSKVQLAERLEHSGDATVATQVRMEIYRDAPREIEDSFNAIRRYTEHVPQYQVDANRLKCEQALMCYSSAVPKIAKFICAGGAQEKAKELFLNAINYYGGLAETAQKLDGRRRTFDRLTVGFATFHEELAKLHLGSDEIGGATFHLEEAIRARRGNAASAWERLGDLVEHHGIEYLRSAADEYYGQEIPPMEFPVTRFGFVRNAERWSAATKAADTIWLGCNDNKRRIAVAAFNLHHLQFLLALSCVLSAKGYDVDFLYLPSMRFMRRCDPEPVYDSWDERFLASEIERACGFLEGLRINLIDLRTWEPDLETEEIREDCRKLAHIDAINMETRMERKSEENDLEEVRFRLNLDAARRAASYFGARKPDLAVLFNGGVMEYGALFDVARRRNIETVNFESSAQRRGCYVLSRNSPFGALDTGALWKADAPHVLSVERRQRVFDWADARGGRDRFSGKGRGRHLADATELKLMAKEIGLDPNRPIVALVPNLTWDTGVQGRDTIFHSVSDWTLQTVAFFAERPNIQLAIRSHPLEETRSDEFLGQFVRERWPQLPPNVALIDGSHPVGSYELLDLCQLVLVYTGNLGIEATIYGIRAIIAGQPHYSGKGFTCEPSSKDAYFNEIEKVLSDPDRNAVSEREIELACAYGDIYWNYIPQPYPWKYDDFLRSIENDWSMDRLLSKEGFKQFGRTFAFFAGEEIQEDGMIGVPQ